MKKHTFPHLTNYKPTVDPLKAQAHTSEAILGKTKIKPIQRRVEDPWSSGQQVELHPREAFCNLRKLAVVRRTWSWASLELVKS